MQLFKPQKVANISISVLLTRFASELNNRLKTHISGISNGPEKSPYEIEVETHKVESLLNGEDLLQTNTFQGLIHSTKTINTSGKQEIRLASPKAIREHYRRLARITMNNKTGTCIGLAALTWLLAQELIEHDDYQGIEIHICQLVNWRHVFIKLSYRGESPSFFYDPWFPYWKNDLTLAPYIFSDTVYVSKLEEIKTQTARLLDPIQHVRVLFNYQPISNRISPKFTLNMETDYSYYISCSTREFSNPAPKIHEYHAPIEQHSTCLIL